MRNEKVYESGSRWRYAVRHDNGGRWEGPTDDGLEPWPEVGFQVGDRILIKSMPAQVPPGLPECCRRARSSGPSSIRRPVTPWRSRGACRRVLRREAPGGRRCETDLTAGTTPGRERSRGAWREREGTVAVAVAEAFLVELTPRGRTAVTVAFSAAIVAVLAVTDALLMGLVQHFWSIVAATLAAGFLLRYRRHRARWRMGAVDADD